MFYGVYGVDSSPGGGGGVVPYYPERWEGELVKISVAPHYSFA